MGSNPFKTIGCVIDNGFEVSNILIVQILDKVQTEGLLECLNNLLVFEF